jgi:hypothetical protein
MDRGKWFVLRHEKKSREAERAWFQSKAREREAEREGEISSLGKSTRLFL